MGDWILGFRKAARDYGPAVEGEAIRATGLELPPDLWSFYQQVDGGVLGEDVQIFRIAPAEGQVGLRAVNAVPNPALPEGTVRFGSRGEGEHLLTGRKAAIAQLVTDRPLPEWLAAAPEETWAFALVGEHTGELRLFRSLERLLWTVVPPAETEEFGESTFVRALNVVESALSDIKQAAPQALESAKAAVKRVAKKVARKAEKKAAPAKAKARTVARKAPKKAAKAPKRATKKPVRKAASPKKAKAPAKRAGAPAKKKAKSSRR